MAIIKKTIENLKPGKQYLLTVKPKNLDINSVEDPVSAVRFAIPQDLSEPAELGNLEIVGNYKSIMISFNPSNEADLDGYNYEVYLPEDIVENGGTYQVAEGAAPYLSGFSSSNVIAIDVPENSTSTIDSVTLETTTTEKLYFARVQSIDTTGNVSPWTPIKASTATTLIDSAHIVNLTASKITAGTIGAHAITLAGATSIIKSSTFDGVDVGGGSYANATTGWLINGSGRAYFYDATIAGSIDIGGFDSGSFHVDSEGNLWLGSGTLVDAPFKVLKEGDVTANTILTKSLTLTGNTVISGGAKLYFGNGEYSNINTPFYVDDNSKFSLGDKLTWDGNTLNITGSVNITGGTAADDISNALSIANSASNTANTAFTLADNAIPEGFAAADVNTYSTTINGNKITTGTLNADRIVAGSITSTQISSSYIYAGSINAGQITAGTLSGDRVIGGTIIGTTISGGTISGATMTTGGFTVNSDGAIVTRNCEVRNGFSYRAEVGFPTAATGLPVLMAQVSAGADRIVKTSSMRELKENIEDMPSALPIVNSLRPRVFNVKQGEIDPSTDQPWTDEAKAIHKLAAKSFGFIAEEVYEDYPRLSVLAPPDRSLPWNEKGGFYDLNAWKPQYWSSMELIAILTKAVQELSIKVDELESRLND